MLKIQILYWHDIPVQVRVRKGRSRFSHPLSERFQSAVDKAAMRAGHAEGDAYTAGYHWCDKSATGEQAGTLAKIAAEVAAELEAQHPEIDWRKTAARLKHKTI